MINDPRKIIVNTDTHTEYTLENKNKNKCFVLYLGQGNGVCTRLYV